MQMYIKEVIRNREVYNDIDVYTFPLDGKKSFDYRMRVSFDAFFHSRNQRCWYPSFKKYERLWIDRNLCELEFEVEAMKRCANIDLRFNYIQCEDIYDFYKKIGYDYKKQKWNRS